MDSNEFWCRAFLAAMQGSYAQEGTWSNHNVPATYCEDAAHAALTAAQRCGMVAVERAAVESPAPEAVEFTAERGDHDLWNLSAPGWTRGVQVRTGGERYPFGPLDTLCVQWGESIPPKPIKVWIERGGA